MKSPSALCALLFFAITSFPGPPLAMAAEEPVRAEAEAPSLDVLKMRAVPAGHYLATLEPGGRTQRVNLEVKDGFMKCVKSSDPQLEGWRGRVETIGNGVFIVFLSNENHRATQFWVFQPDGSAIIKEVPDRGERQTAVPVSDDSIIPPAK